MEIELESIAKVTLRHRHIADYLAQTDPLDRIILLRKGLETFSGYDLDTLEGYIRERLPISTEKLAATLAVCQCARQLQEIEVQPPATAGE